MCWSILGEDLPQPEEPVIPPTPDPEISNFGNVSADGGININEELLQSGTYELRYIDENETENKPIIDFGELYLSDDKKSRNFSLYQNLYWNKQSSTQSAKETRAYASHGIYHQASGTDWIEFRHVTNASKTLDYIYFSYATAQYWYIDEDSFNIIEGDTTNYEPYTSQEADIDLDTLEYCKIGTYEDKFIRSNDGI